VLVLWPVTSVRKNVLPSYPATGAAPGVKFSRLVVTVPPELNDFHLSAGKMFDEVLLVNPLWLIKKSALMNLFLPAA
jgi:hypothetical protein